MQRRNITKYSTAVIFLVTFVVTMTAMSQERPQIPSVPDFEQMLSWSPARDRSMVVTFEGVRFKFEILGWSESQACKTVVEAEHEELKWLTHVGIFAQEYRTRNKPVAYQLQGDTTWRWLGRKTFELRE